MTFLLTGFGATAGRHGGKLGGVAQRSACETHGIRLDVGSATGKAGWGLDGRPAKAFRTVLHGWPLKPDHDSPRRCLSAGELGRYIADNGFQALERLRGSFVVVAVAFDANRAGGCSNHRIDCYRSRAGGRTAYWRCGSDGFAVSDSAFRVACSRPEPVREDPAWLAEFFALSSRWTAGLSPFAGVHELLPGERLTVTGGSARTRRSPIELSLENPPRRISGWVAEFGHRLDRAVADCLPAGQPTAIMLSGGMDSGPMAAIAGEIAQRRDQPLLGLSWRIRGFPQCDEWRWISMLAAALDLPLVEIDAERHLPFSRLDESQVDPDNPMYNALRPLVLTCYENARQSGCEVLLNAAAGDALYPHPNRALVDDIRRAEIRSAMRRLIAIYRYYGPRRLHHATEIRGLVRALIAGRVPAKHPAPPWLADSAVGHLRPRDPWPPECTGSRHPDFGRQLFGAMASGGIAREVRFGQRYGVDRRDPYLDPDLRRLMLQAPHALVYRHGTTKWIAREAMKGRLPEAFRTKPRTGLLNAFFNHGFDRHREEIRTFLLDQRMLWAPWVKPGYLTATLEGKSSQERPRLVAGACIGYVLWKKRIGQD